MPDPSSFKPTDQSASPNNQDAPAFVEAALDELAKPLLGNKAIEDAAVAFVMTLEREAGRQPNDRRYEAAFPGDIESLPRIIEVKAVGGSQRGWFLPLEVPQVTEARANPDFWLYIVDNVRQGDPGRFGLKVFGGDRLTRLIGRAREKRYFEVPVPVREYDEAPGREAL